MCSGGGKGVLCVSANVNENSRISEKLGRYFWSVMQGHIFLYVGKSAEITSITDSIQDAHHYH